MSCPVDSEFICKRVEPAVSVKERKVKKDPVTRQNSLRKSLFFMSCATAKNHL